MLPAYRNVYLRLFAEAKPVSSGAIAADLERALSGHGAVSVREMGPYWKTPPDLEFIVDLTPNGRVAESVAALLTEWPTGWDGDVWCRRADGELFLHPAVTWATISWQEDMALPRLRAGDVVIILDCPAAREYALVGARGVVHGSGSTYQIADDESHWNYGVLPDGDDELICLDEADLEPTGEYEPPEPSGGWISVSTDGRITGSGP
jgi:hypothetical protein